MARIPAAWLKTSWEVRCRRRRARQPPPLAQRRRVWQHTFLRVAAHAHKHPPSCIYMQPARARARRPRRWAAGLRASSSATTSSQSGSRSGGRAPTGSRASSTRRRARALGGAAARARAGVGTQETRRLALVGLGGAALRGGARPHTHPLTHPSLLPLPLAAPPGLPDGDEAGGQPQARGRQVGARRRRDDQRGAPPAGAGGGRRAGVPGTAHPSARGQLVRIACQAQRPHRFSPRCQSSRTYAPPR